MSDPADKWFYEFRLWPASDRWPTDCPVQLHNLRHDALHLSLGNVTLECSAEQFEDLRFELARMGYDMHECSRHREVDRENVL